MICGKRLCPRCHSNNTVDEKNSAGKETFACLNCDYVNQRDDKLICEGKVKKVLNAKNLYDYICVVCNYLHYANAANKNGQQ
jgi:transposase-like protein